MEAKAHSREVPNIGSSKRPQIVDIDRDGSIEDEVPIDVLFNERPNERKSVHASYFK